MLKSYDMEKDNEKKKDCPNKPPATHTGGRKSRSSQELWERRQKAYLLNHSGVGVVEIGRQLGVGHNAIIDDLKIMGDLHKIMQETDKVKARIYEGYMQLIKQAQGKLQGCSSDFHSARYIATMATIWEKVARLYGFEQLNQVNILNVNQTGGGINRYDRLKDDELEAEFKRRNKIVEI